MSLKDPVARAAYRKAWRAANLDKRRSYEVAWRAANRERANASSARWYAANQAKGRAASRKWRSGCTPEQYTVLMYAQGGLCAVCVGPNTGRGSLHADHDHETGVIRGLLCSNCNTAEGLLRGNAWNLARYLKEAD